eukprot:5824684-Pyramimonas_sp.AAC.1
MNKGALKALGKGLPFNIQSVVRDRDNITLVGDDTLVLPFLADELGCSKDEATAQLEQLKQVLPALNKKGRVAKMGVNRLSRLCTDLPRLGNRVVQLKALFPDCDVDNLVCDSPFLLTEELTNLRAGLDTLRELIPFAGTNGTPGVDRMAQAVPQLLDPQFARNALVKLEDVYGDKAADMVHRNPFLVLKVESASLRSKYSVSFDQRHVRANKVVPVEELVDEPYYRPPGL